MTRAFLLIAVVSIAAACEKKPAVPPADGTVAVDTMSARDSVADSTARDSAALTKAPIIGYDSAYGPIGSLDSTGKLVPIRPRRP